MNADQLLEPFRDLVRRRLWPFAVLLIAVAVAAPLLLSSPEEAPAPVAAAPADGEGVDAASIVSVADGAGIARRRVLGARKDPFTPTGRRPKAPKALSGTAGGDAAGGRAPSNPFGGGSSSGGGTPVTGGSSPVTGGSPGLPTPSINGPIAPVPAAPSPAPDYLPLHSLRVEFDGAKLTLDRLGALPDEETPLAIYLGVTPDRKTAVFLLDETVQADGDGTCRPSPGDCQRLYLEAGETEFLEVAGRDGAEGTQHELHLDKIVTSRRVLAPVGSDGATSPLAAASSAGRRALRDRLSRVGRLRYDRRSGVLRKIGKRAHRAEQARARARR